MATDFIKTVRATFYVSTNTASFKDFSEMLEQGMVDNIKVYHEASENPIIRIEGEIPEKISNKSPSGKEYPRNWYVQIDESTLNVIQPILTEKNIGVEHKIISRRFENIITLILPTLLLFFLIYMLFNKYINYML